ncbi:MAG: hypothetical protein BGO78_06060 [Chloroflexi bacterium 44-23]|nr:MAG: hypothetical protein BGO78_06060 [Chloroflexi bacterium 44-23]
MTLNPLDQNSTNLPDIKAEIDALNEKAWQLESIDPQEGLRLSRESYQLSTNNQFRLNNYQKGVADSLFNQANFNLDCGDYHLALAQSLEALSIYTDIHDSARLAMSLRTLAAIYLSMHEYNKAMSTLLKALEIARHLDDPIPFGETLMTMGMVYLLAGDSSQAILEFKKGLQIFQTSNNVKQLAYIYCNLAAAYKAEGEFEIFNQYLERCEKAANQIGSDYIKVDILRQRGQYEIQQGNLDAAHSYFLQSLQLAKNHGYQADQVASSIWISDIYFRRGKLKEAADLLLVVLAQAARNRYDEGSMYAHQKLSQIYEQLGDYANAYSNLKVYLDLELKITNEKNDLKYKSLETVYRTQSLQSEARIIQNKNDQLEKEISERRWVEDALRQSEEKYRRLANIDQLTGLNNRRYFYELALNEYRRIKRYYHPLVILMLDIDQFKKINDQYGHLAGDQILKMVARHLRKMMREVDIIGRFGGEEFIVLLPETNIEQAIPVAKRLLNLFSNARFEIKNELVQITVSIGLAGHEENLSLDLLINRSDQAMHTAQKLGGNQLSVWEESGN